jgi:hypothetical protein
MRRIVPFIACGLGLLVCGAALASDAQKSAAPDPTLVTYSTVPDSKDSHTISCRHAVHEGELLPEVKCASQFQWDAARRETQRAVSDLQMRGLLLSR